MTRRLAAAAAILLFTGFCGAQDYPSKPVKLIVPFAPGGASDAHMRNVAAAMAKQLRQPVIVENVAGGGGNIGPRRVATQTAADGYTIMHHNLGLVTAPALFKDPGFNPVADFDYIGLIAFDPSVVIARGDFPVGNNFHEFLGYVKANQAKIQYGVPAGPPQLAALLFMALSGTRLTLIPYQASPAAMNDLLAGRLDLVSNSSIVVAPFIKSGKLKAIGITGKSRVSVLPEVPTLDEQGLTGYEMVVWTALFAPKNLPKPVSDRLVSALQASLTDPELIAYFNKMGSQIATRQQATPAALQALVKSELEKWGTLLRNAGISPE